MSVIVVGGGFAGMGIARALAKEDVEACLLEASGSLGGLSSSFSPCADVWVENFYHCLLPTDEELLSLIEELGLTGDLHLHEGSLGFIVGGAPYSLANALDLMRFAPLGIADRLRLGLFGLVAVLIFSAMLFESFVYLISKGAIDWGPLQINREQVVAASTLRSADRTAESTVRRVGLEGRYEQVSSLRSDHELSAQDDRSVEEVAV